MRVVVNSPKSLSLSVLRTELAESFPPHFRGNLWNWLPCQANLRWQPPAGAHTQASARTRSEIQHDVLDLLPLFSNLDWLASAHSLPTPPGSFTPAEKKKRVGEKRQIRKKSPIRGMNSGGERKRRGQAHLELSKAPALRSWKTCLSFLLIFFVFSEAPSGILSLIYFCGAKLDHSWEKKHNLGARATHETLHMEIIVGDFKDRFFVWCVKS